MCHMYFDFNIKLILSFLFIMQVFFFSKNRGKVYLKASANQQLLRRNLEPDDDQPLGMKVDGTFQCSHGTEIGIECYMVSDQC